MTNHVIAGRFVVVYMSAMYHTANRGGPGRFVKSNRCRGAGERVGSAQNRVCIRPALGVPIATQEVHG